MLCVESVAYLLRVFCSGGPVCVVVCFCSVGLVSPTLLNKHNLEFDTIFLAQTTTDFIAAVEPVITAVYFVEVCCCCC